ncbi:thioesterase superfamily protein [Xylariaceae sp. AK1471]|nr:thioesterase superfamily protein [Xylariaceae sp. AK1471]
MDNPDHIHFSTIPWCANHLQGNRIITGTPSSRALKPIEEDSLFADTLKSERTIVQMLHVYEEPISPAERVDEVKAFLTLGSGLNGHPNVCHGGLVTTILDEAIGLLLPINMERQAIPVGSYMTAYLNTSFVKPVPTPTTILARACFTKVEGRKYFTQGTIEDKDGVVLARADALYVQLKSSL